MRGSILDTGPRVAMPYLLYTRILVMLVDLTWLCLGIVWLKDHYFECPIQEPKETIVAVIICNLLVIFSMVTTIWCTFDPAGRSWVKMKKYQRSMRESESRFNYKRSGSRSRNWRQRKVIRAYQDSWDHRCRLLFCCMGNSDRSRNSFTDIARLLSDFFRDLDVVPSDVVAGLVLLRKFQKLERDAVVRQVGYVTSCYLIGTKEFDISAQKRHLRVPFRGSGYRQYSVPSSKRFQGLRPLPGTAPLVIFLPYPY